MISVAQIKEDYRKKLFDISAKMESNQKMQVAINLGIAFLTVQRYQSGKIEDVRNIELAEKIYNECNSVTQKATA